MHGLCLKFITLSCQLTFCQPSFPASVPIPPEKQKTPWNLWLCSTYTWPKRGTYQRGLLPKITIYTWILWVRRISSMIHQELLKPLKRVNTSTMKNVQYLRHVSEVDPSNRCLIGILIMVYYYNLKSLIYPNQPANFSLLNCFSWGKTAIFFLMLPMCFV